MKSYGLARALLRYDPSTFLYTAHTWANNAKQNKKLNQSMINRVEEFIKEKDFNNLRMETLLSIIKTASASRYAVAVEGRRTKDFSECYKNIDIFMSGNFLFEDEKPEEYEDDTRFGEHLYFHPSPQASREEKLLDIKGKYTKVELKKAYIEAMKKSHPDKGGSTEQAQKVNQAYSVLSKKFT